MRKINLDHSMNADKIWNELNENGPIDEKILIKLSKLDSDNFHFGIGYLAREDKIKKDRNIYSLDKTNLIDSVGLIAGKVWKILEIWEEADLESIINLADEEKSDICKALGWLYKEDKIKIDEINRYSLK